MTDSTAPNVDALTVQTLPNGYVRISISSMIWAQVPPGFDWRSGIPAKYCFQPAWSHDLLNKAIGV